MIKIKNLTKTFGTQNSLDNISLELNKEDRVIIMGQNGAGKTTLIRSILGQYIPTNGEIEVAGFNPFKNRPTQFRNFLIIHLMLNYGLRVGELMLLTVNSIKKSVLNDSYSLIITNTDDEHDDRRRKPKIKNEFSYRVITLQERDYRFINIYIKEIRSDINSDILFTSLKPPYSSLSYSGINKIFKIISIN